MSVNLINNTFLPKIFVIGNKSFRQEINKLLQKIQSTSIGNELLVSLSSKRFIKILQGDKCCQIEDNIFFSFKEITEVAFLGKTLLGGNTLYLIQDFVGLFHELVHVWLYLSDLHFDLDASADEIDYVNRNEELCITGKTGNISVKFFENALLEELNYPFRRVSWTATPINDLFKSPLERKKYGQTLIHKFAELGLIKGYLDQFQPLLCEMDLLDNYGSTPLHYAACGSKEATEYLLKIGLSPETRNQLNNNPFETAVSKNNLDTVRVFLNFGVSQQNSVNGKNIFKLCHSPEMEQLLLEAGFKKSNKRMRVK